MRGKGKDDGAGGGNVSRDGLVTSYSARLGNSVRTGRHEAVTDERFKGEGFGGLTTRGMRCEGVL